LQCYSAIVRGNYAPKNETDGVAVFSPMGKGLGDRVLWSAVKWQYMKDNPFERVVACDSWDEYKRYLEKPPRAVTKYFLSDVRPKCEEVLQPLEFRQRYLPKKNGYWWCIEITDENIIYIVENYTNEPGIRKFKELLFEIVGEINLSCLKNYDSIELPIRLSNDDIKYKYLNERHENLDKKIPGHSAVGVINGLWANSMGQGGIIPIEAKYFPSTSFMELKLTGLQGDVMKESMNVAKNTCLLFSR